MPVSIEENIANAKAAINSACIKAGRNPVEVTILAATKSQPIEKIREAVEAGVKVCGENYIREAEQKISEFGRKVEWHFIGHLQSNKAAKAVELFDCIQSVDSLKLAKKISSMSENLFPIFLEVNIAEEKSKFGFSPAGILSIFPEISALSNIQIRGLFCMAPLLPAEQTRPFFKKMKQLSTQLGLKELSMGMSNDYSVAVEEGSSMVRLGTALFGKREK